MVRCPKCNKSRYIRIAQTKIGNIDDEVRINKIVLCECGHKYIINEIYKYVDAKYWCELKDCD